MLVCELDTFVQKFNQLWRAGHSAHLDIDTHAGKAWIGLRLQLGQAPGSAHEQFPSPPAPNYRGPAYRRRQERRRQSACDRVQATAAEEVVVDEALDKSISKSDDELEADKAPEEQDQSNYTENTSAAKAETFECELCDFSSIWNNGLKIHMSKKHDKIEQLDGSYDIVDGQDDDDYEGSKHYWKTGWLGSAYQSYLDAMEVLNKSYLDISDMEEEKIKVLEARKEALGSSYKYYPPWSAN